VTVSGMGVHEPIRRLLDWTFTVDDELPTLRRRMTCCTCGATSEEHWDDVAAVQLWVKLHTSLHPSHRMYEEAIRRHWRMAPRL
jgi:hypothetical protein